MIFGGVGCPSVFAQGQLKLDNGKRVSTKGYSRSWIEKGKSVTRSYDQFNPGALVRKRRGGYVTAKPLYFDHDGSKVTVPVGSVIGIAGVPAGRQIEKGF